MIIKSCKKHFFIKQEIIISTPKQLMRYQTIQDLQDQDLSMYNQQERAQYLPVDGKWRFLLQYVEIFAKIWPGNGIFNTRRCPFITGKINKKLGFEIIKNGISISGHLSKKILFLFLILVRFLEHFENRNLKMLYCNIQMSIYFYIPFILIM